jgi:malate synthase
MVRVLIKFRNNMENLKIHPTILACLRDQVAPGTGVSPEQFWNSFADVVQKLGPMNMSALEKRDDMQKQIDDYHTCNSTWNEEEYKAFLQKIGYLLPDPTEDCTVQTTNVDPEISTIAGPQLVVPADNARYALNAANARWGSLYDALYGTNVIGQENGSTKGTDYNPVRGQRVFDYTHAFLDEIAPLNNDRFWNEVNSIQLSSDKKLIVTVEGESVGLRTPSILVGFSGNPESKGEVVLKHNDLHVILLVDRSDSVGSTHPAGLAGVTLEAAVSTIIDFEDSVSAVDAEDKAQVYSNFAGLMKGDLTADLGRGRTRKLNNDRVYQSINGSKLVLSGRSLMLCRNVGMHMYTNAVQIKNSSTGEWEDVPEGMLDCWFSTLAAMHDIKKSGSSNANSRHGSFYIVKPKMHGPEEVALTIQVMEAVEDAFGLPPLTVKIGIMDEERRTTVNLKRCIMEARHRLIFINTGFLDRTGDEIHTSMYAGPVLPKKMIAVAEWRKAYEDWNVDVGMETSLVGKGQIGKGMWAEPDDM